MQFLLCVGAETVLNINGTTSEAFSSAIKNLNGYIGVCADGSVIGVHGRVYYVSLRTISYNIYTGDTKPFNVYEYVPGHSKAGSAQAAILYDENGEQVGVAIAEDGLEERDITVNAPEETPDENAAGDGDYTISMTSETNEGDTPDVLSADGKVLGGELAAFDGSIMYDIVVTNKATKDKTKAFLQVMCDDVAPTLLLDADSLIANKDGKYTISGTTEAGVTVNGEKVGDDGRFTNNGVYEEELGILTEKVISYEETLVEDMTFMYEEEFNETISRKKDEMRDGHVLSYSIVPETYQGPGDYTLTYIARDYVGYSESLLQYYQEREQGGSISNVAVTWEENELDASEVQRYKGNLDPETMKLSTYIQPIKDARQMEVKAVDESGNETKATVRVSAHIHKMKEVPAVPGSCTQTGTISYFECEECVRKFADSAGLYPAPDDLSTPKQPNSHSYGGWKQKTGRATITVKTAAGAVTTFRVKVQSKKVTAKKIVGFKKKLTLKKGSLFSHGDRFRG